MTIKVLIVDDLAMLRAGFAALLAAQPDIDVVGEAANGGHFILWRVFTKLDLRDRAQAVVFAYESGLITAGSSTDAPRG